MSTDIFKESLTIFERPMLTSLVTMDFKVKPQGTNLVNEFCSITQMPLLYEKYYDLKTTISFCDESIITLVSKIFAFGMYYYGKQK